ncbi:MAG: glycosyltransferase family 1 protein [Pseudomonadota bacterium]
MEFRVKIVMITENDPAGMGIAFTNAINRHTEHSCRLITTTTKYNFDFEKDLHVPDLDEDGLEEIRDLLRNADIIHFHILADENIELGPITVKDFTKGKAMLHHHHGHPDFRAHPEKYQEKYRRLKRKVLVSTPDLLRLVPEATWQPNLVPINDPPYLPLSGGGNGRVRICHSPTRKDLKNTGEFDVVADSLQGKYVNLDKVIIENAPHQECLMIKQQCDIHFDHMQGYFGVSSLEGLSQGKPVIAGLDDWNIECIKEFTDTDKLPWRIARSQGELEDKLEEVIADRNLRNTIGMESRRFMEEHWTERHVLQSLIEFYENL